jgi:hypothetical protein
MVTENNGLTYVIFNVSELDQIDFNQVLQTSAETCRRSVDGLQTLVFTHRSSFMCAVIDY